MTSLDFQNLLKQEKARRRAELAKDARSSTINHDETRGIKTAIVAVAGSSDRLSSRDDDGEEVQTEAYNRTLESPSDFAELTLRPTLDMEKMRVGVTPSIYYAPDFVSEADEQQILTRTYAPIVDGDPDATREWVTLRSRRLKCWGGQPGETFRPEPLPPWLDALCDSLVARGVFDEEERPNHVLLNEYQPGQGIMPHTDGPFYEARTATLSLGSDAMMHFSPRVETSQIGRPGVETRPQASLVLRERCLVVFADEAYSDLLHSIDAVRQETVGGGGDGGNAPVINADAARAPEGTVLRRKLRVSLTFRRVRARKGESERNSPQKR